MSTPQIHYCLASDRTYAEFVTHMRFRIRIPLRYDGHTTYSADVSRLNEDLRAGVPEALTLYKQFIAWKLRK